MATLKDVAKEAGVAISTASAVINRSAPVSERTIARVKAAIKRVGYVPNSAARVLRSGQSNLIGVLIPDVTNPYFSRVARIIEDRCMREGYISVLFNSGEDWEREMRVLDTIRSQKMAGLILMPTMSNAEHGQALREKIEVPTVVMNSYVENTNFDTVVADNVEAARTAMTALLRNGHRRIAVVAGRAGVSAGDDRIKGCQLAYRDFGLELDPDLIISANFFHDEAYAATQKFMQMRPAPTAICALNNLMTSGAVVALRDMGWDIPRDASIIGIDDFEWADIVRPGISIVKQPMEDMVEKAFTLLHARLQNTASEPQTYTYQSTLVLRGSVAPLAD